MLAHLAAKHPEIVSHAVVTSAPARTKEENYQGVLAGWMQFCLDHPEVGAPMAKLIPFFKKMENDGWEKAFRVYLAHMGEPDKSQWDEVIPKIPWTIARFWMSGANDKIVNYVGMGAARLGDGQTFYMIPEGGHEAIADHGEALKAHIELETESRRRERAVLSDRIKS